MRLGFNSTIIRREKVCRSCGKPCYPFSKGRCQQCSTREDSMKRMEKATESMIKEEDLSDLISDADAVFSQYIRLKFANNEGITGCFTCHTRKHWTLMQNGHYIKRGHLYLRWDERNCRPQDQYCNEMRDGNIAEYTKRLESESPGITEILQEEMRIIHKPTRAELKQLVADYSPKVKALKAKLNPHPHIP